MKNPDPISYHLWGYTKQRNHLRNISLIGRLVPDIFRLLLVSVWTTLKVLGERPFSVSVEDDRCRRLSLTRGLYKQELSAKWNLIIRQFDYLFAVSWEWEQCSFVQVSFRSVAFFRFFSWFLHTNSPIIFLLACTISRRFLTAFFFFLSFYFQSIFSCNFSP